MGTNAPKTDVKETLDPTKTEDDDTKTEVTDIASRTWQTDSGTDTAADGMGAVATPRIPTWIPLPTTNADPSTDGGTTNDLIPPQGSDNVNATATDPASASLSSSSGFQLPFGAFIALVVLLGLFALAVLVMAVFLIKRARRKTASRGSSTEDLTDVDMAHGEGLHSLSALALGGGVAPFPPSPTTTSPTTTSTPMLGNYADRGFDAAGSRVSLPDVAPSERPIDPTTSLGLIYPPRPPRGPRPLPTPPVAVFHKSESAPTFKAYDDSSFSHYQRPVGPPSIYSDDELVRKGSYYRRPTVSTFNSYETIDDYAAHSLPRRWPLNSSSGPHSHTHTNTRAKNLDIADDQDDRVSNRDDGRGGRSSRSEVRRSIAAEKITSLCAELEQYMEDGSEYSISSPRIGS
ncbi:hypothetical protein HK102_012001 [Quaeritorhiza haematococci]|nr:hypothetical protein HK102_012001 [Quaeritorhiza haematococci]